MNKTVTIYAVVSSKGSYDDYCEWVEKCFTNKDDAYEFAKEVDKSHIYDHSLTDEIFNEVDNHFYDDFFDIELNKFCEEHNIPNNDDELHRTDEQQETVNKFCDYLGDQYNEWCINYLTTHYDNKYTADDWEKYIEYYEHKWDDWHDCKIKELELVIDDEFKI